MRARGCNAFSVRLQGSLALRLRLLRFFLIFWLWLHHCTRFSFAAFFAAFSCLGLGGDECFLCSFKCGKARFFLFPGTFCCLRKNCLLPVSFHFLKNWWQFWKTHALKLCLDYSCLNAPLLSTSRTAKCKWFNFNNLANIWTGRNVGTEKPNKTLLDSSKAQFKRWTSHVPNLMQMSKNNALLYEINFCVN